MKTIDEIPKKNPFKVPENYFGDLNRRILESTTGSGTKVIRPSLYRKLRPFLLAAASVALLAVLSYSGVKIFSRTVKTPSINELSTEELSDSFIDDIEVNTLENSTDPAIFAEKFPSVGNPEIVDYLMYENIDFNDIYEKL